MVTDIQASYTSPAGRECTLLAGRCAGINPAARVLDLCCGYGEGACNLATEFRCKVTAVDLSQENLTFARALAQKRGVGHLITWCQGDVFTADVGELPFELCMAEGGALSFIGRKEGLSLGHSRLGNRGWLAFSDLVFYNDKVPDEVRTIFDDAHYHYETEESYRRLIAESGFDIHYMGLVPLSGWDNYYAHMARRLEDETGFFADKRIKQAFHKEIDVFYRLEGFRYVAYLFGLIRKKN